jgi:hypothetical protein
VYPNSDREFFTEKTVKQVGNWRMEGRRSRGYDVVVSQEFIPIYMKVCATMGEDQSLGNQSMEAVYIPIVAGSSLLKKRSNKWETGGWKVDGVADMM